MRTDAMSRASNLEGGDWQSSERFRKGSGISKEKHRSQANTPVKDNVTYGIQAYPRREEKDSEMRKKFFKMVMDQMNKTTGRLPPSLTFSSLY